MPAKLQPAILGGLFIGILSALPLISVGNACCCLWIVCGGLLASYIMQQNHPGPIQVGDGAVVGLLAGIFGALVWAVVSIPIQLVTGPIQAAWVERIINSTEDIPPQVMTWLEAIRGGAAVTLSITLGLMFMLFFGIVFGAIGGVLGAIFFRPKAPPGTIEVLPPQVP